MMKQRFIYTILPLLAMLGMLASCSREELGRESDSSPQSQNGEIRFEMGFAPMDVATQTDPQTRVATDTEFKSTWEEGDEIGIFAVEHGGKLAGSGNLFHNVKLTYSSANGGKWTAAEPMIWPKDGTKLDFYAYYPYNESIKGIGLDIRLPDDQSGMTDKGQPVYNRNDVLWCKNINGIGKNEGTVSLPFIHRLAMVQVKVSSSMLGGYAPDALDVWLDGAYVECSLEISGGGIGTNPNSTRIKMYPCPTDDGKGTYAYRALVIPGGIGAGTTLFRFEYNGTDLLTSPPMTTDLRLESGRVETFDMTFPFTSVTVSPTVRIADLIPTDKLGTVTHLKVLGEMTAADFTTINDDMPSITSLDLSGATVEGNAIPDRALFYKRSLTEFVFPRGVTTIGASAFWYCDGLSGNLTIPESVTTIGDQAFSYCSGLSGNLTIPNSVTTIGELAFSHCSGLTGNLTIPNSVTTIGENAFSSCSNLSGSLTISESVTVISNSTFYGCSKLSGNLKIPNRVTTIGQSAFYGCSNLSGNLTIPESVTVIGQSAFYGCSNLSGNLTIPNSVTYIGGLAFEGCSGFSGNLTIPNSVTYIGDSAFKDCSGFSGSLTIPNSVTYIGGSAFYGCTNIKSIYCYIENPDITYGQSIFKNIPNTIPVYVPLGTLGLYKDKEPWSYFNTIEEMHP